MTTVDPLWTILVATLGQRREYLARLLDGLMPQVDAANGAVRVMVYFDNGELTTAANGGPLGAIAIKRQALLEATTTKYVSSIDDDDTVSGDYVPRILDALGQDPDYVGFWLSVYRNGLYHQMARISLRHGGWYKSATCLYRDITHANPMRTSVARLADFRTRAGRPEDVAWARQIRKSGLLKTEVFINKVLYHYWWQPAQSAWVRPSRVRRVDDSGRPWQPLAVDLPYFSWHPDSIFPGEGGGRVRPVDRGPVPLAPRERSPSPKRVGQHRRLGGR